MPEGEQSVVRRQLEQAMAALEAQRASLGDAVVEVALASLREKLAALAAASAATPELPGERKLVTVMFADLSGFTAMAERLDPEAVREVMNACFEHLVPVVEKYEGTVDKFIGDEIMALFGAPAAHENDPERALRAALEMVEALGKFNADRGTDLELHFGINTGLAIAGGVGTRERQEYSVVGDVVNLALQLEHASERGEILVGPDTYRLTAPLFEFQALAPMRMKGKAEPVLVYRLLAARAVPGQVRGIEGLASPLVGRVAERQALWECVERLQAGVGGIVTLVGDAGLGKSRLVAEVRRGVVTTPLHWVEGRCHAYGAATAYLLWLDVLRGLLGVTAEEPPLAVRDRLREQVQTVCPGGAEAVYSYLARLASLPLEAEDEAILRDLTGEWLKIGTFQAVESLLESVARVRPLVVVCEDLQWADPTSIELLEYLLHLTGRAPLLLMGVFRPDTEHGSWRIRETSAQRYRHRHTDLWLTPLSAAESETLVGNLLHLGLPPRLRERILSRAEGNPFYVEEIIRSLLESGVIVRDEAAQRWGVSRDAADIAIPDTLHGVLVARIDRLQEETKRVLQLAAVVGRVFSYRVLAAIVPEEGQLDDHLLTLQRQGMIRERARLPELEYIFKHNLTQEAAYNGLLKKERRAYHRQVAEALERLFPERVEEQVGLLAHHWERAEEPEKATKYLLLAGDQARLAYAHREAIEHYERALAFLKAQGAYEQAARTLMKLGLAYHTAFDYQRARQAYEEGFALWQRAGETPLAVLPPAPHAFRVSWPEPATLDPTLATDSVSLCMIQQLFSGLVELQPDMDIVPDVARGWEVLEGGRKYVFRLREDVRWSDGRPVTAGDFEYAWKRVLDPATSSLNAELLDVVKGARAFHQGMVSTPDSVGVRALDDLTLVVELEGPTGYFLNLLAYFPTFPVPRHVVEQHGAAWTQAGNIVTNGPFRLEDLKPNQSFTLSRNPSYHGRFGGNVQHVEGCLLRDRSVTLQMYEAGDLDVCGLLLWHAEMDRVRQRHAGEYFSAPRPAIDYVGFDLSRPPFDDPRVRRAFVHATDREMLADIVLRGNASPATGGFVPPRIPGHSPRIGLLYDPDRARQLLAEAGYPGGRGFPVVAAWTDDDPARADAARVFQTQWHESLEIEVAWKILPVADFLEQMAESRPHLFCTGWAADYPDPDNFLRVGLARHSMRHWNATFDELIERARRSTDQAERMRLYQAADRLLIEEAVVMPVSYGRGGNVLIKPWVIKYPTSPLGMWFWKDVVIEPH